MKITRRVSDGSVVYYQSPDFEDGKGILNAVALYGGVSGDYEEVTISGATPSYVALRLAELDELYKSKFYSNVTALFPSGTKTIQLRNADDFSAFERVVLAAITRQSAKREEATVQFRTEDNVTQELPASEFIPVALDVLDAKHALWKVRTAHKDSIHMLTEEQASTYNVNTGWPETNDPVWVQLERAKKIYKAMIRRRAEVLSVEGKNVEAIELLKTIGE